MGRGGVEESGSLSANAHVRGDEAIANMGHPDPRHYAPGSCCDVLLEAVAEEFQGVLGGPEADAFAVAGDLELFDLGVFAVGEADVDEAYGFAGVCAAGKAGAGDACDA